MVQTAMKYTIEIPDKETQKPFRFWPFRSVGWQAFWSLSFLALGLFCLYKGIGQDYDLFVVSQWLGFPFVFIGLLYFAQILFTTR